MQTIKLEEILNLYQKCGVMTQNSHPIRTNINRGTLENKLNTNYEFLNRNSIQTTYTNNTMPLIHDKSSLTLEYNSGEFLPKKKYENSV